MLSTARNYDEITDNLGKSYEISLNTYKPFACGIVIHPTIDACIQLRNRAQAARPARSSASTSPCTRWCWSSPARRRRRPGSKSKFSVYFAAALAIVRGSAGMRDFSDENARDPVDRGAARSRRRHRRSGDEGRAGAGARSRSRTGGRLEQFVEHVVGSLERPMSDADLEAKFLDLAKGVLPDQQARNLIDLCWKVEAQANAAALAAAAVPPA